MMPELLLPILKYQVRLLINWRVSHGAVKSLIAQEILRQSSATMKLLADTSIFSMAGKMNTSRYVRLECTGNVSNQDHGCYMSGVISYLLRSSSSGIVRM